MRASASRALVTSFADDGMLFSAGGDRRTRAADAAFGRSPCPHCGRRVVVLGLTRVDGLVPAAARPRRRAGSAGDLFSNRESTYDQSGGRYGVDELVVRVVAITQRR